MELELLMEAWTNSKKPLVQKNWESLWMMIGACNTNKMQSNQTLEQLQFILHENY